MSDDIPTGWQKTKLGSVATIIMGQAPPGTTVVDWDGKENGHRQGLPFIQGNAEFSAKSPMELPRRRAFGSGR